MQQGNWMPITKTAAELLPKRRKYTELEALFSLQKDFLEQTPVSVNGYAALWGWSKGRVRNFIKRANAAILYPEDTTKKQNQNGLIIDLISDRSDKKNGLISDRSSTPTKYIYIDKEKYTPFNEIKNAYNSTLGDVLPRVRTLTDSRRRTLKARWSDRIKSRKGLRSDTLEFWQALFNHINESCPFLTGRNDRNWRADFDFIIKKKNFVKIIEGGFTG